MRPIGIKGSPSLPPPCLYRPDGLDLKRIGPPLSLRLLALTTRRRGQGEPALTGLFEVEDAGGERSY